MSLSFSSVDTGADTQAGQNYAARQAKLLASLSDVEPQGSKPVIAIMPEVHAPNIVPQNTSLVDVLGLQEASDPVEIILQLPDSKGPFSVTIKPIAINITEDCVTILMDSTINIKPPALQPLTIKKNGILYSVVYAGAVLQTPKLNVLSFIRTNA